MVTSMSHHYLWMYLKSNSETALSIGPDAIKTGMLGTEGDNQTCWRSIEASNAQYFVVDPVMVCKGEDEVLNPGNTEAMIKYLLPKATVVTPNLFGSGSIIRIR